MEPKDLAAAALGALALVTAAVAVDSGLKASDSVVVSVTVRETDGRYRQLEASVDLLPDGGVDETVINAKVAAVEASGAIVMSAPRVKKCDTADLVECALKSDHDGDLPCRMPVDETCLRTYAGTSKAVFAGFNVMPAVEASGNCRPVQCTILSGDPAP